MVMPFRTAVELSRAPGFPFVKHWEECAGDHHWEHLAIRAGYRCVHCRAVKLSDRILNAPTLRDVLEHDED